MDVYVRLAEHHSHIFDDFDSLEPVANQVDSCQRMLLESTGISAIFSNSPSPLSLLGIGFTIAFGKNLLPCCTVGLRFFFLKVIAIRFW